MLVTKKKVRVHIPKNEHPFVMKSLFVYKAKEQGWSTSEIKNALNGLDGESSKKVWFILNQYCLKKSTIN